MCNMSTSSQIPLQLLAVGGRLSNQIQHMLDDLPGRRHVPAGQRPLAAVPHGSRKYCVGGHRELHVAVLFRVIDERHRERGLHRGLARRRGREKKQSAEHVFVGLWEEDEIRLGVDGASERTLSSPAQKMNSASGFWYNIRLTISPFQSEISTISRASCSQACQLTLFTAIGLTSRFFLPTSTSIGLLDTKLFSNKSWHCLHWNCLQPISQRTHPNKNRSPPLGISRSIMPSNRALLHLDMAPRRALRIISENLSHLFHPPHI